MECLVLLNYYVLNPDLFKNEIMCLKKICIYFGAK